MFNSSNIFKAYETASGSGCIVSLPVEGDVISQQLKIDPDLKALKAEIAENTNLTLEFIELC